MIKREISKLLQLEEIDVMDWMYQVIQSLVLTKSQSISLSIFLLLDVYDIKHCINNSPFQTIPKQFDQVKRYRNLLRILILDHSSLEDMFEVVKNSNEEFH